MMCRWERTAVSSGLLLIKASAFRDGTEIGYHPENDKKRFTVTDSGIVVIGKGTAF